MKFIKDIIGGGTEGIMKGVSSVLDNIITNKEELIKAKAELEKVFADEMDSARQREILINQSEHGSWLSKNTSSLLALLFVFGTMLFIGFTILGYSAGEKSLVQTIIEGLINICIMIMSYYFGSSQGAAKVREQMNEVLKKVNV